MPPKPQEDELTEIAVIQKNTKEYIKVILTDYNGHRFIDCRVYYEDAQGELKPTRKGISLNADTIDEVIEALRKGNAALKDSLSPIPARRQPRPGAEAGAPKADGRNISERVRAFVESINGSQFSVKDSQRALGLTESREKHLCNVVLAQLASEGVIERTGQGRGIYRRRNAGQQ
jgi:hypothetical protein